MCFGTIRTGRAGTAGAGRLKTNSFGFRLFGPITESYRYTVEYIFQNGRIGLLPHRAYAWVGLIAVKPKFAGKKLDFATDTDLRLEAIVMGAAERLTSFIPLRTISSGMRTLSGWRNIRNVKTTATWAATKSLTLIAMYNNSWLASSRDAAYNAQGAVISRSVSGSAGTHIGQEADLYMTWKNNGLTVGAGVGQFFAGGFIKQTTPGINPQLLYVFQTYSF